MATVFTTTFELRGSDGGPLRGEVRTAQGGDDRPAVVLCHGFKGFKNWGFFPPLAERMARAGFTAVTFNFSGSGVGPDGNSFSEAERFARATFSNDLADIGVVCRALMEGRLVCDLSVPTKLAMFGHSRGGGTSVLHAARSPDVAAVVTWAAIGSVYRWPSETVGQWRRDGSIEIVNARTGDILPLYTDFLDDIDEHGGGRLDIAAAASRVAVPWLIIHGDEDETVPVGEARQLYASAPAETTTLGIVPGASHTFGARHPWAGYTRELRSVMDETVGWFTRHLL